MNRGLVSLGIATALGGCFSDPDGLPATTDRGVSTGGTTTAAASTTLGTGGATGTTASASTTADDGSSSTGAMAACDLDAPFNPSTQLANLQSDGIDEAPRCRTCRGGSGC